MPHTLVSGHDAAIGTPHPGFKIVIRRVVLTQTTGSYVWVYTDMDASGHWDTGEEILIFYAAANTLVDIPDINLPSLETVLMDSSNVTTAIVRIHAEGGGSMLGCVWWDEVAEDGVRRPLI